jgi:hypothetical protein
MARRFLQLSIILHFFLFQNACAWTGSSSSVFGQVCLGPSSRSLVPLSSTSSSSDEKILEETSFDRDAHVGILDKNLKRYTNRGLLEHMFGSSENYHPWDDVHMSMRFSLMSHGNVNGMDGPVNNYCNFGACSAYHLGSEQLRNMPACRMAQPGSDQQTWSAALQRLREDQAHGCLENYQGFRCTMMDQRKFYIRDALVSTG